MQDYNDPRIDEDIDNEWWQRATTIRKLVQQALNEYADNECGTGELLQALQYHHGTAAQNYVRTQDNDYWLLCRDINELIQEIRHARR